MRTYLRLLTLWTRTYLRLRCTPDAEVLALADALVEADVLTYRTHSSTRGNKTTDALVEADALQIRIAG